MPSAVMPRRPLSLPYTKENPMKRKWMMVLGFLPLLMGIPPSHHLDAAPGLYLSKAGMALPAGEDCCRNIWDPAHRSSACI